MVVSIIFKALMTYIPRAARMVHGVITSHHPPTYSLEGKIRITFYSIIIVDIIVFSTDYHDIMNVLN